MISLAFCHVVTSALVVMLGAISLGRVALGLVLIVAFSLGLAGTLTGVGLLFVHEGRWLCRFTRGRGRVRLGQSVRFLPVLSAVVVTTSGGADDGASPRADYLFALEWFHTSLAAESTPVDAHLDIADRTIIDILFG